MLISTLTLFFEQIPGGAKRCVFIEKLDTSWKNGHVLENKGEISLVGTNDP